MRFMTILMLVNIWLLSTLALPVQHRTNDVSYRRDHIALRRRTNQPPGRKLTLDEWFVKTTEVKTEVMKAFRRNPVLKRRFNRALGYPELQDFNVIERLDPEQSFDSDEHFDDLITKYNNALRRAGYEEDLLPPLDEMENYTDDELVEYFARVIGTDVEVYRTRESDPGLIRRFRKALGLDPNGPWPKDYISRRIYNRALRAAGYRGPLYPLDPRRLAESEDAPGSEAASGGEDGGGKKSNEFSLNEPPHASFLSTVKQSLRRKLDVLGRISTSSGSPFQPLPLLPIKGLAPLIPI
ncbi:MAG: hypothetical protein M1816_000077 [Peltula sp. TS41687]|nr:MAG: hypothetical protein M1816_000077 [Peltula sp. TS41687]